MTAAGPVNHGIAQWEIVHAACLALSEVQRFNIHRHGGLMVPVLGYAAAMHLENRPMRDFWATVIASLDSNALRTIVQGGGVQALVRGFGLNSPGSAATASGQRTTDGGPTSSAQAVGAEARTEAADSNTQVQAQESDTQNQAQDTDAQNQAQDPDTQNQAQNPDTEVQAQEPDTQNQAQHSDTRSSAALEDATRSGTLIQVQAHTRGEGHPANPNPDTGDTQGEATSNADSTANALAVPRPPTLDERVATVLNTFASNSVTRGPLNVCANSVSV